MLAALASARHAPPTTEVPKIRKRRPRERLATALYLVQHETALSPLIYLDSRGLRATWPSVTSLQRERGLRVAPGRVHRQHLGGALPRRVAVRARGLNSATGCPPLDFERARWH